MATISAVQLALLRRAHESTLHVYQDPARVGGGIMAATLAKLLQDGLLALGDYVPSKGRPLLVTTKGLALLIHFGQVAASQGEEG